MDEKNPLQLCSLPANASNNQILNKSGRPNMKNMVKFSPQPKSIIAKMLSEMKTKNNNSNKDDDDVIICQSDQTCDIVETDKTDEHICQTCSHRYLLHSLIYIILNQIYLYKLLYVYSICWPSFIFIFM